MGYLQVGFRRISSAILTLLLHTQCMFSWHFFFSHCRTNVTQSSQSIAEILKIEMCKYLGSNFLGLFRPLPMKEIELWSNTIWDSGPGSEIILKFSLKDWSTFGLGLEPFSSTVEGLCIWNLWSNCLVVLDKRAWLNLARAEKGKTKIWLTLKVHS